MTGAEQVLVRVHTPDVVGRADTFLLREEDVRGLTPDQVKDRYALPTVPTHVSYVSVPAGVRLRVGEAVGNRWGAGGGVQYQLRGKLPDASYEVTSQLRAGQPFEPTQLPGFVNRTPRADGNGLQVVRHADEPIEQLQQAYDDVLEQLRGLFPTGGTEG